jgi:O-acetyl-ADP-ribose deacetylase
MEIDFPSGKKLRLVIGDITKLPVDAIVNAANSGLRGGGGVDGAIHRAGGPVIMRELDTIRASAGGCPTGSAVVTGAGALPAQYVFHAVGPVHRDGLRGEPEQLASCYRTCLDLARQHGARSISFPAISTGVYGYPLEEAAGIALETIASRLADPDCPLRDVLLVLYDQAAYATYARVAAARVTSSKTAEWL